MHSFDETKRTYENTEIPEELGARMAAGIREGRQKARRRSRMIHSFSACAACFVLVVAGLNISPTFASAAADLPVMGKLFQVLTVRSFAENDPKINSMLSVNQPAVQGDSDLAQRINAEIQDRVDRKIAEGNAEIEAYHSAFLSTGGTEEEWLSRPAAEVAVNYEIKSQTDTTVSFLLRSYISIVNYGEEQVYYNLDLAEDRELTVADRLGENWVSICNDAVHAYIADSEESAMFFAPEEGGFVTVDDTTMFYLNEDGDVVLVFPKYAIAPGYFGSVEIPVTTA